MTCSFRLGRSSAPAARSPRNRASLIEQECTDEQSADAYADEGARRQGARTFVFHRYVSFLARPEARSLSDDFQRERCAFVFQVPVDDTREVGAVD